MARYRKIDPRIWNDRKFRALGDDGQFVFLLLLTHPSMTALGAMRATPEGLAAEKGWLPERLAEAFRQLSREGIALYDAKAACVWIPNFLKYNPPESANVVKAWVGALDLIPECELKDKAIQAGKALVQGMNVAFADAFREAFGKAYRMTMPIPEQEPEQEQEGIASAAHTPAHRPPKPRRSAPTKASKASTVKVALPADFALTPERQSYAEQNLPSVDAPSMFETFRTSARAKGWKYIDWHQAWQTYVRNSAPNSGHWSSGQYPRKAKTSGAADPYGGAQMR